MSDFLWQKDGVKIIGVEPFEAVLDVHDRARRAEVEIAAPLEEDAGRLVARERGLVLLQSGPRADCSGAQDDCQDRKRLTRRTLRPSPGPACR